MSDYKYNEDGNRADHIERMDIMSERWMPKDGDRYWFIDERMEVQCHFWMTCMFDRVIYKIGNCFRTKEEAEDAAEKVKDLLLSLHNSK